MNPKASPDTDAAARGIPPFSAPDYKLLRNHVVSMRAGRLHKGPTGSPADPDKFLTNEADLAALLKSVKSHIDAEPRSKDKPARIMLHAHGGLVSTEGGLDYARTVIPWWLKNGVYPIFFVWESGLWNTLGELIDRWWDPSRELYLDEAFDPALEMLLRNFAGRDMWTEMKARAEAASTRGGAGVLDGAGDGAAALFADGLGSILSPLEKGTVAVHAVGHSAGSVFLGHFLEAAKEGGIRTFDSVSLLAPAMRVGLFKETFVEAMKAGQVKNLSMFTMTKEAEHDDTCMVAYRKSLLYLVSRAFEAERGAAILGLQETVHADPQLNALFAAQGPASVVWSPTPRGAHGRARPSRTATSTTMRRRWRAWRRASSGTGRRAFRPMRSGGWRRSRRWRALAAQPRRRSSGRGAGPTRKALCIGIDDYPSSPLTGCVADANRWAKAFTALEFDEVTVLTDEEASTRGILMHLTELVANAVAGDVVAVQFSGHGTDMPDLDLDELVEQDRHRREIRHSSPTAPRSVR